MKNIIKAFAIVAMFGFVACSGSGETEATETTTPEATAPEAAPAPEATAPVAADTTAAAPVEAPK